MRLLCLFLASITFVLAGPAGKSDSAVEADLRARLSRSKLAPDGIQVRVQGGVATLTGRTNVIQHKGTATRMAKSAGASQVMNKIQISEEARRAAAQKLAAGRNKARTEPRTERVVASRMVASRTTTARPAQAATPTAAKEPPPQATPGAPPIRRAQIKH